MNTGKLVTLRNKERFNNPQIGDLRIWWIPQVPMSPFYWPLKGGTKEEIVENAGNILDMLAEYDMWQLENNIKPDFSNVGGLEIYEADNGDGKSGWCDWYSEDGEDLEELRRIKREEKFMENMQA